MGVALGIAVVVCVAVVKQWTPVRDLSPAVGAPLAGALAGLVAGLYPSLPARPHGAGRALRAQSQSC